MNALNTQIQALKVSIWGRLLYTLIPYRRPLVMANVEQVYGNQLNISQKKRLVQAFYTHLATSFKEAIHFTFLNQEALQTKVTIRGQDNLLKVAAEGKGVLLLSAHTGNWEFAPMGGFSNFKAFPGKFHFIRRSLGNKWLERLLFKRYHAADINIIPKKNALRQVITALNKQDAVVFVLDQHASIANRDGIAVEFFGKKAGTYQSLASFAGSKGMSVVPGHCYRLENGQHVLEFLEPLPWQPSDNKKEAILQNTKTYNAALEKMILKHPEQWMWFHRRWKLRDLT